MKRAQRIAWLAAHPALLARLPDQGDFRVSPDQDAALVEALRGLKAVKLFAETAQTDAARWTVQGLVSELRRAHAGAEAGG